MTQYTIRRIRQKELPLMEDFLYEAIFIPEGAASPPKSIVKNEDLQVYVRDFGLSSDDNCYKKIALGSERKLCCKDVFQSRVFSVEGNSK